MLFFPSSLIREMKSIFGNLKSYRILKTKRKTIEQLIPIFLEILINDFFFLCSFVWHRWIYTIDEVVSMLFFLFHFHIIWLLRGPTEANAVQSSHEDCILAARHVYVPITMWPRHLVCMSQWKLMLTAYSLEKYIHTRRCSLLSLLSTLIKCDRMNKWVCFCYGKRSKILCFADHTYLIELEEKLTCPISMSLGLSLFEIYVCYRWFNKKDFLLFKISKISFTYHFFINNEDVCHQKKKRW
jgi:hypothetical protein